MASVLESTSAADRTPFVELGELMSRKPGSINPAKRKDQTFELYSIPAYEAREPELQPGAAIGSSKQRVQPNDVLVSKIVPHIRRAWVVGPKGRHEQIASGEWIPFRSDRVEPNYLRHLLISDWFHPRFMQTVSGVGGSLLRARPAEVAKIKIPLPPLPEQRRIAAILDKADALRQKRRAAIAKLDQLLQSVFLEMFGDPVTNPRGWEAPSLESVSDRIVDCPHSTPKWAHDGVVCLRTSNIGKGRWMWDDTRYVSREDFRLRTKRSAIETDDIILSREGTVGIAALITGEMQVCMGQRLVQVRAASERVDARYLLDYLLYVLHPDRIGRLMVGSTSKHLNVGELRKLKILLPPLNLQRQYTRSVKRISEQIDDQRGFENICSSLFFSLQQRAFTGQL